MSVKSDRNQSPFLSNDESEEETFLLQWSNQTFSMNSNFASLREKQDFIDVTLVAEESVSDDDTDQEDDDGIRKTKTFGAHKVILSAFSPYLRNLLKELPIWKHPVIFLRDIPAEDLEALLTFVYAGRVQVGKHQLNSFLKSGETLRIHGLTHPEAKKSGKSVSRSDEPVAKSSKENVDPLEGGVVVDVDRPSKRFAISTSQTSGKKRPKMMQRPPPKPVTTTISTVRSKEVRSPCLNPNPVPMGMVFKKELQDPNDNFRESGSIPELTRNLPDEHLVIPSINMDSNSMEDISTQPAASTSEDISETTLGVKTSLCPLCRAVLSNGNALSYHMNYLHGITDPQFFNAAAAMRIKEDLS